MSTKLEMPDNLPPLPPAPKGYDRWEYRGNNYGGLSGVPRDHCNVGDDEWFRSSLNIKLNWSIHPSPDTYVIEAVKDDPGTFRLTGKPEMVEFCGGNGKHTGMYDMVNSPPHYQGDGIECIDAIKAALTPEEFRGYLRGNCLKYLWRCNAKGGLEDLRKAEWYLKRIIGDEKA